jgi:hypothetical protein
VARTSTPSGVSSVGATRFRRAGREQEATPSRVASLSAAPLTGPLLTVGLAAALCAVAVGADGGLRLGPATVTELFLTAIASILTAVALVVAKPAGRAWGGGTLVALGALTALSAASIVWAVNPSEAWIEADRIFSYLATFAAAIALVRLVPARWRAVLGAVLLACTAIAAYALLTKVLPDQLNPDETFARLREPFGYWNAIGLMAALGATPALWIAARREGSPWLNAAAVPALSLLLVTVMLAYSRGSIIAVLIGLAVWFAIVPLRLRGLAAVLLAALAAAPVVAWAFASDALSKNDVALAARSSAGHELGLLLAIMVVAGYVLALGALRLRERREPGPRTRRRAGIVALTGVALVPVALAVALSASSGGLSGQVSGKWHELTNAQAAGPANDPGRLTETGSVRSRYWREGFRIYADNKLVGAGIGSFAVARKRYRHDVLEVRHAHGYVPQVMADLGLAGLLVSLLVAFAWILAAVRTLHLRRRDRDVPWTPERIGLATMATVVIVFVVHSALDWTWFVPGTAVVGILCAGWVAGRGPLVPERGPKPLAPAWRPLRIAGAAAVLAAGAMAMLAIWQPLRSQDASNTALDRAAAGDSRGALASVDTAIDRNPLAVEPRFDKAAIQQGAGMRIAAEQTLEDAVALQPSNAETWRRLADIQLQNYDPAAAMETLRAAIYLNPRSKAVQARYLAAAREAATMKARAQRR